MGGQVVIEFPYECPRCGARGELSVDAMSRDDQSDGVEAARRDLRSLLPVLRCPSCGKRPRRAVMAPMSVMAAIGAMYASGGHTVDLVMAATMIILGYLGLRARLRRADKVRRADGSATIRLAATIPEARVLALPPAPTASPAPESGTPS